jgi:hypothetical protein
MPSFQLNIYINVCVCVCVYKYIYIHTHTHPYISVYIYIKQALGSTVWFNYEWLGSDCSFKGVEVVKVFINRLHGVRNDSVT